MFIYEILSYRKEARELIEKQMWNNKPVCPYCSSDITHPRKDRGGHRCYKYNKDFTVKTGTIFETSRLHLHKWLYVMYLFVAARKGISSMLLSKELGVTQKSTWFLLQRIREACNNDNTILDGIFEIDEAYIGGLEKNKHESKKTPNTQNRSTKTKTAVVGFNQRDGRVKAKVIDKIDSISIQEYINNNIQQGSILATDAAIVE